MVESTEDGAMTDETAAVVANRNTPNSIEELSAFMEKRNPVFNR
ncbi:MAG: hypothetical protein P8Q37_02125 [Porticoccaceae bacterium]|nr:hypothetical protein [Porticoccaceae bacterium]